MTRNLVRFGSLAVVIVAAMFAVAPIRAEEPSTDDGLWTFLADQGRPTEDAKAWPVPPEHIAVRLDPAVLEGLLTAPVGAPGQAVAPGHEITVPLADGSHQRFRIEEVPILSPALQAQHPDIRTYAGVGIDDPAATIRCTYTILGFQAQIRTPTGTTYVDPYWRGDTAVHAVYDAADATDDRAFACHVEDHGTGHHLRLPGGATAVSTGTQLRTYLVILQLAGEYEDVFGGAGAAFAAATTTLNNVSGLLENDTDVRLQFTLMRSWNDPGTDPFSTTGNYCAETQAQNDSEAVAYDLGHLFGGTGYSGNACCIGCVCSAGSEGGGWSTSSSPTGASFTFLVAHEMGHQLGGRHTWSGTGCDPGNFDSNSAQEPGGGSTIMSYFSVCGADDLIPGQAPGPINLYYHRDSIERIVAYTQAGGGNACPVTSGTGNSVPSVNAGPDLTIPSGTPFVLTASGSDPDGDPLTYCWEQTDIQAATAAATTVDDGVIPLFRSFPPTTDNTRTFPLLSDLIAGNLFPGTLGEQLPVTNRTISMSVVARDNQPGGGGVTSDDMVITVAAAAGPFAVTSPNGGESWPESSVQTVTWNVAGTDLAPINEANVRILLSTDGGFTYPTVLLASTPNDGSENVTMPACLETTTARVRIEAIVNVFFDISDADFTVTDDSAPVVTAFVTRSLLWPVTRGMLDVGLTHAAVDNCTAVVFQDLLVHSDELNGAAPYAPDAQFTAPTTLKLRAERAFPGDGRVYLAVPRYADGTGNVGAGCVAVVAPINLTVAHVSALLLDASVKRAACLAGNGAAPAGTTQILP